MNRYSIFLIVYFQSIFFAFSQNNDPVQTAKDLRKEYKENKVVLLNSKTELNYSISGTPSLDLTKYEVCDFIGLEKNTEAIKKLFFNDQSSIISHKLTNGKGKKIKYDTFCGHYETEGIFYSDMQICAYHFVMPEQGDIVHFDSEMAYKDPRYLTKLFFHEEQPVVNREIIINVPGGADIEILEMNFEGYNIEKKRIDTQTDKIIYWYKISDIEVIPHEDDIPGITHFLPHLLILVKSYNANNQSINVLSSLDDLYSWYASLVKGTDNIDASVKDKVQTLITGLDRDEEKIKAIYYWVQDNIKYIAFEDGLAAYRPESADKVFYNRYGDCKGMANLTKCMLREAGFDARLTWVGTNKIPYTYDIPSLAVDNHMICYVMAGDKKYILDPTEKYNKLNFNGERIQGKQILIEDGAKYIRSTVPVEPIESYIEQNQLTLNIDEDKLQASGNVTFTGEYKKLLLNLYNTLDKEDSAKFIKVLVSGDVSPDMIEINSCSSFEREAPIEIDYSVSLPNHMNSFGNEIYLDMDISKDFKGMTIEKERKSPYFFETKVFKTFLTEINIPAGYQANHIPEPISVENEYFKFDMKYEVNQKKVIYKKEIKVLQNILPVSHFGEWNDAVRQLNNFYNNQLILIKDED